MAHPIGSPVIIIEDKTVDAKNDILGVVLVGGKSTRFGQSKARLVLPQQNYSVTENLLSRLSNLNLPVAIVTNSLDRFSDLNIKSFCDIFSECGPLGGLYTALKNSKSRKVLSLTCDMPLVSHELLNRLLMTDLAKFDACVFEGKQGLEPFPGLYTPDTLEIIEQQLHKKKYSMRQFLNRLIHLKCLCVPDMAAEFLNINTQEDFKELVSY